MDAPVFLNNFISEGWSRVFFPIIAIVLQSQLRFLSRQSEGISPIPSTSKPHWPTRNECPETICYGK
jgi:hypothetical protein